MSITTVPDTDTYEIPEPVRGQHTNLETLADELEALAAILRDTYALDATGRITETTLMVDFQIAATGPNSERHATVELLNDALLGVAPVYERTSGHYHTDYHDKIIPGAWIEVYGDMKPPPRILAAAWDEAHAERDVRILAEMTAANRLQAWFNSHDNCCGLGYRENMDHEHERAQEYAAATDCERCTDGTGRHSFGIRCGAHAGPVHVQVAPADTDLLHDVYADADVAQATIDAVDDRGWEHATGPAA